MKSQYIIILTIIITLTASMLFLAQIEKKQRTDNQNFWSIYFVDPLGTDNHFVIDNKTPEDKIFHYDITIDKNIIQSEDIEIEKNTRKLIETDNFNNQNIKIIVTQNDINKQIEKK